MEEKNDPIVDPLEEEIYGEEKKEESSTEKELEDKLKTENGILRRKLTKLERLISDKEEEPKEVQSPDQEKQVLELRLDGYSKEEAEYLVSVGGVKALDNPYYKKTIDVMREQKKAELAADIPDSAKGVGSEFSEVDIKTMSAEEYRKKVLKQ